MLILRHLFLFAFLLIVFSVEILQVQGQMQQCLPTFNYQDLPYWRANFVFTGLVEKISSPNNQSVTTPVQPIQSITTDSISSDPVSYQVIRFAVEKSYRGNPGKNIEILSNFSFKEGERYFVYASRAVKDEKIYQLDSGVCGRPPILLKDAKEDVEYAQDIASDKSGTRIYGFVYQDKQDSIKTPRQSAPLSEIIVTIKSEKNIFTTKTDGKGKYIFKNIPPGAYKITASTPKGMHEREIRNNWRYGKSNTVFIGKSFSPYELVAIGSKQKPTPFYFHSDSYNFVFTSLSSIEGKVVDSDGNLPPQQFLWLLPVDENGNTLIGDPTQYLWVDKLSGKFVFDGIPKGKYRIAINRYNCHIDRNPEYGRSYFPGNSNELYADLISVDENQSLKLQDFRLPSPLKERSISGIVLAADKSPLANARVFMMNRNHKSPNECFSMQTEVITDESGHFELKGYETYEYQIRAYTENKDQSRIASRLYSKMFEIPEKGNVENLELTVYTAF